MDSSLVEWISCLHETGVLWVSWWAGQSIWPAIYALASGQASLGQSKNRMCDWGWQRGQQPEEVCYPEQKSGSKSYLLYCSLQGMLQLGSRLSLKNHFKLLVFIQWSKMLKDKCYNFEVFENSFIEKHKTTNGSGVPLRVCNGKAFMG